MLGATINWRTPCGFLKDFAEKAGLTPKRLNEIESGTGEPATIVEIEALAKALDMPAWRLMQIVEESGEAETKER